MEEEKKKVFFCSYFRHISPWFYSNFDRESLLDAKLNSTSNEYPLNILLIDPATPKTRNTWKNGMMMSSFHFFQVFLVFGVARSIKSMPSGYSLDENLILHPTRSPDQNFSKETRRYVENTNKKDSFLWYLSPNLY